MISTRNLWKLAAVCGLALAAASRLGAGVQDELVTVYFSGGGTSTVASGFPFTYNYGTVSFSISEGQISSNPAVTPRTQVSNAYLTGQFETPWKDLRMEVGRIYQVAATISDMVPSSVHFLLRPPPGYRIDIMGHTGDWVTGSHKIRLLHQNNDDTPVRAGASESLVNGRLSWGVHLGALLNGTSAGSLRLIDNGYASSWSTVFTPSGLKYTGALSMYLTPSGLSSPYFEGAPRQLMTPEALVDIIPVSTTEYELRFYDSSTITDTSYPYGVSGKTPYIVYNLKQPSGASTKLQITSKTYDSGSTYPGTPTRTVIATIERSDSWPTYAWTVNDWNVSGQDQVVQNAESWVQDSYTNASTYTNTGSYVVKTPGGSAATEGVRTMAMKPWGEVPLSSREGASGTNLTTTFDYYTDAGDIDSYSRVKSITGPGGSWEAYEYYGPGEGGTTNGGLRIHRPYRNSPSSAPSDLSASTDGVITKYVYAPLPSGYGAAQRLTQVETRIDGTLVGQTDFELATGPAANGQYPSKATRYDWWENDANTRLKTVTRYYDYETGLGITSNRILSIEHPDKSKTVYVYQLGSWNGSAFTKGSGALGSGTASRICTLHGTTDSAMSGASSQTTYDDYALVTDESGEVFYAVANRSTMEVTVRDAQARVVRTEQQVWDGDSWEPISADTFAYNAFGLLTEHKHNGSTLENISYSGELKASSTDATGTVVNYTAYDAAGRLTESTRTASGASPELVPALVTAYAYDAAGRLKTRTDGVGGAEQLVASQDFDTAGRLISESVPGPNGTPVTTGIAYDAAAGQRTITLPNTKTRIETMNADRSPASITGTGVIHRHFAHSIDTGGWRKMITSIGTSGNSRKVETWTDWLGRAVKTSQPGFSGTSPGQDDAVTQSFYDSATGQLKRTTRTGCADTIYEYDSMGRMKRSGLDVTASQTLTDNSLDRISESEVAIESFDSAWWLKETTSTFFTDSSTTKTRVSTTRTRLSGLSATLQAESRFYDGDDDGTSTSVQTSRQTMTVNRGTKTVTYTTSRAGIGTDAIRTVVNGYTTGEHGHDNVPYTYEYDGLLRLKYAVDPRTGTTQTVYKSGSGFVDYAQNTTNPSGTKITYGYDDFGRLVSVKNQDDKFTYTQYDDFGRAYRQWGGAATPVEYGFDTTYGDPTTITTYRGGTGWGGSAWPESGDRGTADTTTSAYDAPSGLLISKTDAASAAVTYEYNSRRQVSKRTWARGAYATYAYDTSTGELTGITYSGSTAAVSYAYTRAGQLKTAGDTTTGTHTFAYDTAKPWRLDHELLPSYLGDRWLSPLYEASGMVGRAAGFQLGTSSTTRDADLKQEWQYESGTGRFDKVLSSHAGGTARTFDYGYAGNSDLLGSLTVINPGGGTSPFSVARTYEDNRDLVTRVQTNWSGSAVAQFDYGYTNLGQRDWEKRGGSTFTLDSQTVTTDYQYNDRGELTKALAYLGTQADIGDAAKKMPNLQHEYGYDNAGNRTTVNQTGDAGRVDSFTANNLNQITARDNKSVIVSGTVGPAAAVAVKVNAGAPLAADRQGSYWSKALTPGNSTAPDSADITLYAGDAGSAVRTEASVAYVGQQSQSISRDADGNITGDGVWTYDWDGENRLIQMTAASGAVGQGFANRKIEFKYDFMNRRVQKAVYSRVGSTWSLDSARRFIYQGWNLVAEYDAPDADGFGSIQRSYTWGLDLAGSLSATGGVGALLQVTQHAGGTASYLPAFDGNGNVMALYDSSSGTPAAIYEYSPFGELLRAEGAYARANPFRFSTKFTDDETGLVYYGHRYYSPSLGRFISRDPIGEAGGLNLYGFAGNDGVNGVDVLGLEERGYPQSPWAFLPWDLRVRFWGDSYFGWDMPLPLWWWENVAETNKARAAETSAAQLLHNEQGKQITLALVSATSVSEIKNDAVSPTGSPRGTAPNRGGLSRAPSGQGRSTVSQLIARDGTVVVPTGRTSTLEQIVEGSAGAVVMIIIVPMRTVLDNDHLTTELAEAWMRDSEAARNHGEYGALGGLNRYNPFVMIVSGVSGTDFITEQEISVRERSANITGGFLSLSPSVKVIGAQVRTIAAESTAARTFTSSDPLVANLANKIEAAYPGHVVGVNVPIRNAAGELVTDADILLQNAVIQVKSGGGKGLTSQLLRTEQATGLPTIGYGPTLKLSVVKGIQQAGGLVTRDEALLIEVVKP